MEEKNSKLDETQIDQIQNKSMQEKNKDNLSKRKDKLSQNFTNQINVKKKEFSKIKLMSQTNNYQKSSKIKFQQQNQKFIDLQTRKPEKIINNQNDQKISSQMDIKQKKKNLTISGQNQEIQVQTNKLESVQFEQVQEIQLAYNLKKEASDNLQSKRISLVKAFIKLHQIMKNQQSKIQSVIIMIKEFIRAKFVEVNKSILELYQSNLIQNLEKRKKEKSLSNDPIQNNSGTNKKTSHEQQDISQDQTLNFKSLENEEKIKDLQKQEIPSQIKELIFILQQKAKELKIDKNQFLDNILDQDKQISQADLQSKLKLKMKIEINEEQIIELMKYLNPANPDICNIEALDLLINQHQKDKENESINIQTSKLSKDILRNQNQSQKNKVVPSGKKRSEKNGSKDQNQEINSEMLQRSKEQIKEKSIHNNQEKLINVKQNNNVDTISQTES